VARVGGAFVPRLEEAAIDLRVLLFALAMSLASALLFGVAPLLQTRTRSLLSPLLQAQRGTAASGRTRGRDLLVVTQIALSVTLAIAAGLLTRSLISLQQLPPGFTPARTLTMQLRLQYYAYNGQTRPSLRYEQILQRLAALPGVDSAAMTTFVPGRGMNQGQFAIAGRGNDLQTVSRQTASYAIVSPDYFRTLRIPVLDGRAFTQADDRSAPMVVVINETMARQFFPGETPIGRQLLFGTQPVPIVGVVGDTRVSGVMRTPMPQIYRCYLQAFEPNMRLVARTTGDPIAMTKAIEQAVWSIDPDQVLFNATTLDDVLHDAVAEPRQRMMVSTLVAGVALAMALTGLFGLVSYRVLQRTKEIGVRMALGAQQRDVLMYVLRHTLLLVLIGVGSGMIAAFAISRTLGSVLHALLYGASAGDLTTYLVVSVAFVATALLATALPARRAAHIDPASALRHE
jgi:putative ABC transport system permease protein